MQDKDDDVQGQGGYRFDTAEHKAALKEQRAQLWTWLKNVGSNMFREGINLTKISLPVCLFEPRSFLERLTTNWEYNDLLVRAAAAPDPADRMRYVVAFAVSGLCRQVSFHKPFNPVLGETYQATYANGLQVFCEQISHHPPISSWQVYGPDGKFVFYGNGNWVAGIKGNAVKGRQTGVNCVQFADNGTKIEYDLPGLMVKGVLWGLRVLKYQGTMRFKDAQSGLEAVVEVDPQPNASFFSGWFSRQKKQPYKPDQVIGRLMKGDTVVDTCHGNWLTHLDWEKGAAKGKVRRIWDAKQSPLTPATPSANSLASDCRHREDVVFLAAKDQTKAQEWKHTLEERQRRDRKLRKEGGGYEH